ncbi:MAG: type II toxin-antitoxin system YafQ family toxin [Nitrospira sp.]|nr:type II toxin-antitoxin system YafQ family toxin [Nitrospira sp.]
MLKPRYSRQFKKDIKKIEKSGNKDMEKLKSVVRKLLDGELLERKYLDHPLAGNLKGYRDCHIEPDWILLYRMDSDLQEITFVRTGSHSELFG